MLTGGLDTWKLTGMWPYHNNVHMASFLAHIQAEGDIPHVIVYARVQHVQQLSGLCL